MAIGEIKRIVAKAVRDSDETEPGLLAEAIVRELSRQLGGTRLYIPLCVDRRDRDEAIRREFNGRNMAAICARYGINRRRVYQIVRGD